MASAKSSRRRRVVISVSDSFCILTIGRRLAMVVALTLSVSALAQDVHQNKETDEAKTNAQAVTVASDALAEVLDGISTLQGDFLQRQYDESGELLLESRGQFRLLRPDYFYWEIQSPDSQLVIADPEYVWHHDRDLETATRRPAQGSDDMAPLQILNADAAFLRNSFLVSRPSPSSYELSPNTADFGFNQVTLDFTEQLIQGMIIEDKLGQRIVVQFSNVVENDALTIEDFAFTPPQSADVFYYDQ